MRFADLSPERRLGGALALALAAHGALFALLRPGAIEPMPFEPVMSFEVSLVERTSRASPAAPLGPASVPSPAAAPEPAVPADAVEPQPPPPRPVTPAKPELTTTAPAQRQAPATVATKPPAPKPEADKPATPTRPRAEAPPPRTAPPRALELMASGLDQVRSETAAAAPSRGRVKRADPGDTATLEGFYAADWVRKVERIGALNFPEQARRQNLTGALTLTVTIRADGSVVNIAVVRSSGVPALDQGAIRIVELGAPYAPFTPELRQRVDALTITRQWQFLQGAQLRGR